MSAMHPTPVAEWAPVFTKHFTDKQIVDPNFMIAPPIGAAPPWCKLCDAPLAEAADKHIARHTNELARWRGERRKEGERSSEEKRRERAALRAEERGTPASSVTEERYLANRVTSARYKLNHPEKHGHPDGYPQRDKAALHDTLEQAIKALADYREKAKAA